MENTPLAGVPRISEWEPPARPAEEAWMVRRATKPKEHQSPDMNLLSLLVSWGVERRIRFFEVYCGV
jgi:hypothetical protein